MSTVFPFFSPPTFRNSILPACQAFFSYLSHLLNLIVCCGSVGDKVASFYSLLCCVPAPLGWGVTPVASLPEIPLRRLKRQVELKDVTPGSSLHIEAERGASWHNFTNEGPTYFISQRSHPSVCRFCAVLFALFFPSISACSCPSEKTHTISQKSRLTLSLCMRQPNYSALQAPEYPGSSLSIRLLFMMEPAVISCLNALHSWALFFSAHASCCSSLFSRPWLMIHSIFLHSAS